MRYLLIVLTFFTSFLSINSYSEIRDYFILEDSIGDEISANSLMIKVKVNTETITTNTEIVGYAKNNNAIANLGLIQYGYVRFIFDTNFTSLEALRKMKVEIESMDWVEFVDYDQIISPK